MKKWFAVGMALLLLLAGCQGKGAANAGKNAGSAGSGSTGSSGSSAEPGLGTEPAGTDVPSQTQIREYTKDGSSGGDSSGQEEYQTLLKEKEKLLEEYDTKLQEKEQMLEDMKKMLDSQKDSGSLWEKSAGQTGSGITGQSLRERSKAQTGDSAGELFRQESGGAQTGKTADELFRQKRESIVK